MALKLFAHPFSSYCWKALIALHEKGLSFEYLELGPDHPDHGARLHSLWSLGKFPVLLDGDRPFIEASVIIEHLDIRYAGERMLPPTPDAALEVRFLDRFFDNYVMTPMNAIVADFIRTPDLRDPTTVAQAKANLDKAYDWLEAHMAAQWQKGSEWAHDRFGLAECAAAPSLFYADWVREIGPDRPALAAYRARLLERPSVVRCVEAARPFRGFFPPGAPDRD